MHQATNIQTVRITGGSPDIMNADDPEKKENEDSPLASPVSGDTKATTAGFTKTMRDGTTGRGSPGLPKN